MSNGPAICEKPPYICDPICCDRVCTKYVIPDGFGGHTVSIAPNEMPLFRRTQITPLPGLGVAFIAAASIPRRRSTAVIAVPLTSRRNRNRQEKFALARSHGQPIANLTRR